MPLNDLAAKMIARVTLEIALRKEFDYLIPPELVGQVDVGSRVQVPFGPRKVSGCVTAIAEESAHARLKPILKVIGAQTLVTPKILKLARWMGEYYCCPPEIALKSVLPEAVRKEQSGWRERLYVRALTPTGELPKLAKRQREVWNIIEERREMPLQELVELAETTSATVRHLEDKGLVAIAAEISERDPYAREQILPTTALDLNLQQVRALVKIKEAIDGAQVLPTGSTRVSRVDLGVPPKSGSPQSSVFPKEVIRRDAELNPRDAGATLEDSSHSSDPTRGVVSEPTVRRRRLPHFEIPGSIYHLTWRTHGKLVLSPEAREKVLAACHHWHGEKIKCYLACVMPDHVHLLIQPLPVQKAGVAAVHPLSEILHSIKSFSAHEANKVMKRKGPVWTDESFDRMIRSESDLHEKWEYIWNNPRVLGLVGPLEEYPFIWTPGPPGERAAGTIRRDAESNPRDAGATPEIGGASVNPTGSAHILPFLKGTIRRDAESNPRDAGATPEIGGANVAPAGAGHSSVFLLHGVTGSGKTEVYLQALAHALEQGKGGIVLVPEISLTPQTVERFKARFSSGPLRTLVAVLHSHLSAGERHDEWHKIRQGRARVVIGARSAIFAPVDPLGLIIVDEEHEHTYKQEESPRYHARDVAIVRGQMEGATVVLGSATPSMESFYNCGRGKYTLLEMPERVDNIKMPIVRVVDMRQSMRKGQGIPIFSPQLKEAITQRLERKEQTILFLNRRGFSTSLQCTQCGYVAECPNCSVSLTFHRKANILCCHVCGHTEPVPGICPNQKCRNPAIRYSGLGTEKVEDTLAKLFPEARIKRMDSDALKRKDDYRRILGDFRIGKIDILVGTQMIAKGLHFPNVTLVGIISADLALHIPDFRASERTFQLLTQVAGRAGRGDIEGEVVVQSFTPFHPAIQYARRHDFGGFYEQEIEFREQLKYPPLTRVALLTLKGRNEDKVKLSADHLRRELEKGLAEVKDLVIAGPAPAPLARAESNYRHQIMLRAWQMTPVSRRLAVLTESLALPEGVTLSVDIDPVDLA